ncbi:MAG TPA: response regulator transcription factor [Bacteroidota bacterium]|nr:response regulator transcription factor [Bacteroidota bacterium]
MAKREHDQQAVINVAIVEDRGRIRDTIVDIINATPGLRCVGAYDSVENAMKELEKNVPDVLLMDIGLPGLSGIEGVKLIKSRFPSIDVLMHTVYDDDDKIFQSICAGASGYVLKNAESTELIRAIKEIRIGAPMSPSIARRLLSMVRDKEARPANQMNLTPRELDILQWLVEGYSYKRIAEKLFISPLTVQSHIKRVYEKLQVHSKSAAVSKALKYKLFG